MEYPGKLFAESIQELLLARIESLKKRGIIPTGAVILVGDDQNSWSFIKQKMKTAERIGLTMQFIHLSEQTSQQEVEKTIHSLNADSKVHGIILQKPLSTLHDHEETLSNLITRNKDVDGFLENSPYTVPVAKAVYEILVSMLTHIHTNAPLTPYTPNTQEEEKRKKWISMRPMYILGRGITAGKPIATYLQKLGYTPTIITSKTPDEQRCYEEGSIIISCVGKEHALSIAEVPKQAILISVGLTRSSEGKLVGDYTSEEIASTVSFYTPTPGGVGPINVSFLLANIIEAAEQA